jgi:polyisoprenoid-binding protein YceI
MLRSRRWLLAGLIILAAPLVGTFVYLNVLRDDPPPRLTLDDVTTTTTGVPSGSAGIEGTWSVADGSIVGYRVQETLFGQDAEAVGRTEDVTGQLTVSGTTVTEARFEVDLTTVTSDESRRDGQFQGRIMETDQFPTATFVLTAPVDLGAEPDDGEQVTTDASGDLTLHGVTRAVTIPLTAERNGNSFAVDGTIVVTFADYGIDNPSAGPAQVGDEGELEVLLVFAR